MVISRRSSVRAGAYEGPFKVQYQVSRDPLSISLPYYDYLTIYSRGRLSQHKNHARITAFPQTVTPSVPSTMCLISSGDKAPKRKKDRYGRYVERESYYAEPAPRPVSNYHGGLPPPRSSATYVRRTTTELPREAVTYRRSVSRVREDPRISMPRLSGDGGGRYVERSSRTYVR